MKYIDSYIKLLILTLKCFIILVVFGFVLPIILDYFLYYVTKNIGDIYNSTLVYKTYDNINLLDRYIKIFNSYIKY